MGIVSRKTWNGGRGHGWTIELDGRVVGALDEPTWVDMFWYSYAVRGDLVSPCAPLLDDDLWGRCRFTFRNRASSEIAANAFCGGRAPFVQHGRVLMRALYVPYPSMLRRARAKLGLL